MLALAHESGWVVELADLSFDGGILAEAKVRDRTITPVFQEPMPVEIYDWWASAIVELATADEVPDGR